MALGMAELIKKCVDFDSKAERIEALRINGEAKPSMKTVIQYMFHPDIKFALPSGDPPYRPSQFDEWGRFYAEVRKLYLFVEGGHPTLNQMKREFLFVELLESIHPEDAKLVLAMKDKKSPYKGLTKDVAIAAFPELFPT